MSQLLNILTANFNREELKTLAFELGVDFDEFPDKGKTSQARDLIQHLQRRQRLNDLIAWGQQQRPKIEWPTPDSLLEGKRIVPVSPQLQPYLEMVMRRYGRLPLSPLDPSGRESARVSLAQVFINLDAAETEYARYQDDESRKMVSEQYIYRELLRRVVTMFATGEPPIEMRETLETIAFIEAALQSARTGRSARVASA